LTGILNGSASLGSESGNNRGGIAAGLSLKQNFQSEKIGETEVLYNFNGLSEWQHFNGVSMNQGCGTIGSDSSSASSATASQKTDYYFRDSQIVSHLDCIIEMGLLELHSHDPILITCGRDGLIKLWR
jgi:hypothetical protein